MSYLLPKSLAAWGSGRFAATLQEEIQSLGPAALCLQALSSTGHPLDTGHSVTLMKVQEAGGHIRVTLGVFFEEIVPGCSCGYESDPEPAYGELSVTIDTATALASITPAAR